MNVVKQICFASLLCCGIAAAQDTSIPSQNPYLLRLEHSAFEAHSCALLQNTGAFHLEIDDGDNVRVFEGTVEPSELLQIERDLDSDVFVNLSQPQIQEPLIRTRHDELQVTVFRGDSWQDLFFQSSDSQQPFQRELQPLVRWLDHLHKLPHRELSEDEGKNNCLPPKVIALKKRDGADSQPSVTSRTTAHILSAGPAPQPQPQLSQPQTRSVPALLRVDSLEMKSGSARESCVLLAENGAYRFEDRTQKANKPVKTKIGAGQITAAELQQLHQLLDDPSLVKIKHHEPPGRNDVYIMGDIMDISIARTEGVQRLVLSSRFNRPDFPAFYRGDADLTAAQPLLKFLAEHVENNPAEILDPAKRNGCSEAP